MKISITGALSVIFPTFVCVLFVSTISAQMQTAKLSDFHYGIVHELESNDLSPAVIDQLTHVANYDVRIEDRGVKDDLRIYQIMASGGVRMPLFHYEKTYVRESSAR